jgi:iron(III) transport system substrate-binding protein
VPHCPQESLKSLDFYQQRLQKLESEEMKQIRSLLSVGCLLVVLNSLGWAEVFAQAVGQASVIEGAKKEGKVVWYATLNISDSNSLLHRFEQKYPFIKTELLRAGSEQLLNRIFGRGQCKS